jgi:hypothetical protein
MRRPVSRQKSARATSLGGSGRNRLVAGNQRRLWSLTIRAIAQPPPASNARR